MKIMQVTLLKISKEHSKSGDGCHIRILGKGVEMGIEKWELGERIFLKGQVFKGK